MAKTVLVVDDDQDFLQLMNLLLAAEGYYADPCPVPSEAHERARSLRPEAIIVDLVMPRKSGWDVIEDLKNDPVTKDIPTIVCTAAKVEEAERIGLQSHGCLILPKPFELDDLLALLGGLIAGDDIADAG